MGLAVSPVDEPSQNSCWLSGMNGYALVAATIELPGTPCTFALWVRYLADCGPVSRRVAWTSAQTYFCTTDGSDWMSLLDTATTFRPGMPSFAICSASMSGCPPFASNWASGP